MLEFKGEQDSKDFIKVATELFNKSIGYGFEVVPSKEGEEKTKGKRCSVSIFYNKKAFYWFHPKNNVAKIERRIKKKIREHRNAMIRKMAK